jgi:hypothetical protein
MSANFETGTKVCCGPSHDGVPVELPVQAFNRDPGRTDGLDQWCKDCMSFAKARRAKGQLEAERARQKRAAQAAQLMNGAIARRDEVSLRRYMETLMHMFGGREALAAEMIAQYHAMKDGSAGKIKVVTDLMRFMLELQKQEHVEMESLWSDEEIAAQMPTVIKMFGLDPSGAPLPIADATPDKQEGVA